MAKLQNWFKFGMISLLVSLSSAAMFMPTDNHLIACGADSAAELDDHRVFLPDSKCEASYFHSYGPKIALSTESGLTPLHRTARIFPRPATYVFQIGEPGAHLVRLHFYPFSSSKYNLSSAMFYVSAGKFSLLANFSTNVPVVKEFIIRIDSYKLVIDLIPSKSSSFAFINAIEVISAPKDLIGDIASLVKPDRVERFERLSSQGFETLYRLNIGGKKITPFNDTLWRTWLPEEDSSVKLSDSESKTETFTGRINYLKYGASREVAPDNVYDTARFSRDSKHNLSWAFSLSSNNKYLVRMHFCDIVSMALNELYFNTYLNGYLGNADFDLSRVVYELATPYYIDYIIDTDNSGLLNIVINPSNLSQSNWVRGLLNGLEIFKMNSTEKGLVGEIPVGIVVDNAVRRGIGAFVMSALVGLVFAAALIGFLVLAMRWRTDSRSFLGLADLDSSEGRFGMGYQMVPRLDQRFEL